MSKETNIRVSLDTFKALEGAREDFDEDHDAILRRVMQLAEPTHKEESPPTRTRRRDIPEQPTPTAPSGAAKVEAGESSWEDRGVELLHGTRLVLRHKGKEYSATIIDGAWRANGKEYSSPSSAARGLTDSVLNGWQVWRLKVGDEEVPLNKLEPGSYSSEGKA